MTRAWGGEVPLSFTFWRAEVRPGDEVTYDGSDGCRHYLRVTEVHDDGSVTVSRGYYGESRLWLSTEDNLRFYRTGRPVPFSFEGSDYGRDW